MVGLLVLTVFDLGAIVEVLAGCVDILTVGLGVVLAKLIGVNVVLK